MNAVRLSVGMLTVIPVKPPERVDRPVARVAMLIAPVAVLPVAALAGLAGWGAIALGLPVTLAGLCCVAVMVVGTRAIHADGLADTVDGLGSAKDAERALTIMKASDIGPMGVTALILVLGGQALAASAVLERPWGWVQIAFAFAAARVALSSGCSQGVPAARPGGLGAMVAETVPVVAAVIEWVVIAALAVGVGVLVGQGPWLPVVTVALAAVGTGWLLRVAVRRFGGITGDVLGAVVELSATVLLVVSAVSLRS